MFPSTSNVHGNQLHGNEAVQIGVNEKTRRGGYAFVSRIISFVMKTKIPAERVPRPRFALDWGRGVEIKIYSGVYRIKAGVPETIESGIGYN